ncbi:MAG TPA: HEPN domain-containing protein [Sedimentisphaerales bacterium]|nr:HEPN domain-containing protein [Sedimentisphaerales bacterium]
MTAEERSVIKYRMQRAYETIEEAKTMFDSGHVNAYVNSLYYACFYAVSALLLTKDMSTSKHGYARSLMHRDFVKTGLISKEMGKHYDLLFASRQEGDYTDFVIFKAEQVASWLTSTQEFVSAVEILISKLLEGAG